MYDWKEGSHILSLRHGTNQKAVSLYRADPAPQGEVEGCCKATRLATNVDEDGICVLEATHDMVEIIKNFVNHDKT